VFAFVAVGFLPLVSFTRAAVDFFATLANPLGFSVLVRAIVTFFSPFAAFGFSPLAVLGLAMADLGFSEVGAGAALAALAGTLATLDLAGAFG